MTDTQWPRFQVFHQEQPDRPHTNAGAVHAPDAELALQNARDVFVRRPDCVSLWVVPADNIFSLTAEELSRSGLPPAPAAEWELQRYLVFIKRSQAGSHEHAGAVSAGSGPAALGEAVRSFGMVDALVWWVVTESLIERTEAAEVGSLFGPAKDKPYREQAFYHTTTLMRQIRGRPKQEA
ncbi:MAG: phenylacetic acid degradation protein [Anaerolineales bacterium]